MLFGHYFFSFINPIPTQTTLIAVLIPYLLHISYTSKPPPCRMCSNSVAASVKSHRLSCKGIFTQTYFLSGCVSNIPPNAFRRDITCILCTQNTTAISSHIVPNITPYIHLTSQRHSLYHAAQRNLRVGHSTFSIAILVQLTFTIDRRPPHAVMEGKMMRVHHGDTTAVHTCMLLYASYYFSYFHEYLILSDNHF